MLRCPKCGEENPLGAIFCRGCTEKLDLDDIEPEFLRGDKKKTVTNKTGIIFKNLLILSLLIVVIGIPTAIFWKPDIPSLEVLGAKKERVAKLRFRKFRKGKKGSKHKFRVSEVNFLTALILELTEEDKAKLREEQLKAGELSILTIENFYIDFLSTNKIRAILEYKLKDTIPFYVTFVGTATGSARGLQYNVLNIYLGRLPIPSIPMIQESFYRLFNRILDNKPQVRAEIKNKIQDVEIKDDLILLRK